jgi:DNA repair exonuclease SbcCD ATPase subunit
MKILKVTINNILCIENIDYVFGDTGLVLIDGINHDDTRSNGAGKTSLFNAISFGIFEKIPRNITKTEILRRGTKSGYSEVTLQVNNDIFVVRRERPNNVIFTKNDIRLNVEQAEFEKLIGMSYAQFLITMYAAQDSNERFVSLNDSSKKDFILTLMRLERFSTYHDTAKSKVTAIEANISKIEKVVATDCATIAALQSTLIDETKLQDVIAWNTNKINALQEELLPLSLIQKPDVSSFLALEEKIKIKRAEFADIKAQRNLYQRQLDALSRELRQPIMDIGGAPIECPSCRAALNMVDRQLFTTDDIDAQNTARHSACQLRSSVIASEIEFVKEQINDATIALQKSIDIDALEVKIQERKRSESAQYDASQSQIRVLNTTISTLQSEIQQAETQLQSQQARRQKIMALQQQQLQYATDLSVLQQNLGLMHNVCTVFSPTGAPAYVMDTIVDAFNDQVNDFIGAIWSNASYKILTHKVTSANKVSTKFSEVLTMSGSECSLGSLSGGEFRALSLAVDFTICAVVERYFGQSINPLILDEPFNGLDAVGRELVVNLLEKMAINKQVIVVDHAGESKSMFDKVVVVEKRNGIATIA